MVYMLGGKTGTQDGEIESRTYSCKGNGSTYKRLIKTDKSISSLDGDSGAPLVREDSKGSYTLVGIVKGLVNESDGEHTVYTRWDTIETDLIYNERSMTPVEMWIWP